MEGFVVINNTKHYFLNRECTKQLFFTDSNSFVEQDIRIRHPLGLVFKPRGCIDTPIRFIIQPNKAVLLFNLADWETYSNPYNTLPIDELYALKKHIRIAINKLSQLWQKGFKTA